MWIDSHTHIYMEEFDSDREEMMARAAQANVSYMLMPNVDSSSIKRIWETHHAYPTQTGVAMGLHPTSVTESFEDELCQIRESLLQNQAEVIAIGEVGIDLYWEQNRVSEQQKAFAEQIEWALEYDLPLQLHVREAFPQAVEVLQTYRSHPLLRGLFHSFSATQEQLQTLLEDFPSFSFGINGIATFKNAAPLRELLPLIPLDKLLIETDAPYLAPVPKRGKRNEPAFVAYTGMFIAQFLNLAPQELAQHTTNNFVRLFGNTTTSKHLQSLSL